MLNIIKQKILEEQLWGNCHISIYNKQTNNHQVLNYKHWQESGLVFVKDIKMTDAKIDENFIFQKLTNRHNWISEVIII